jgi:photosystem II stability/assembly factor-like uncharacterized protein
MIKLFTFLVSIVFLLNFAYAQNQWTYVGPLPPPQPNINSIAVVNQNVIWVACDGAGLYLTTNAGINWTLKNAGIPSGPLYGIAALDVNKCWVGTGTGSIYYTSNGGTSWTLQIAVAGSFINGIHFFNANTGVYTGDPTGTGQPYQNRYTTNGGTNWIIAPNSPVSGGSEWGVINAWDWTDQSRFWLGSANVTPNATTSKIFRTTTGFSGTWLTAPITGTGGSAGLYYQAIAFTDNNNGMTASNGSNIKKTNNGGATWTTVTNPPGVTTFAAINMHGFKDASNIIRISLNETAGYKVFRTTNFGTTWTQETLPIQGTGNGLQHMQFINQNLGYAGGGLGSFFRYGPPTNILGNGNNTPSEYILTQNYPNPFNPTTTIEYAVPYSGFVSVKVFDVMGREIIELVSGEKTAGNYIVQFDGSELNSGIYFYTLEADGFKETKKMLLIK